MYILCFVATRACFIAASYGCYPWFGVVAMSSLACFLHINVGIPLDEGQGDSTPVAFPNWMNCIMSSCTPATKPSDLRITPYWIPAIPFAPLAMSGTAGLCHSARGCKLGSQMEGLCLKGLSGCKKAGGRSWRGIAFHSFIHHLAIWQATVFAAIVNRMRCRSLKSDTSECWQAILVVAH